jgi:hypothetical protein
MRKSMLERLLLLIAAGGTHTVDGLARKLGLTQPLIEAMIAKLEQLGYLQGVPHACGASCQGCPSSSMCGAVASGHIWSLSEKGALVAGRLLAQSGQ